ncbi:MAG TPA: penicillin-binding protein 2 [Firmicutes bacterium]|nr:penicillin-binding protein 2 [Bacillota bacterium]
MGVFLFRGRLAALAFFFLCGWLLLVGKLFHLQVLENKKLAGLALAQRVQEVPVAVARGDILDRNGQALTNTSLHYSVLLFPGQIANKVETAESLSSYVQMPARQIVMQMQEFSRPFKLKTDVDAVSAGKVNSLGVPGVVAVEERLRYGFNNQAAHVLGYINASDNRGMSGIEQAFDSVLRTQQVEAVAALVDGGQQLIPGLGYKRIILAGDKPPAHVVLTLDSQVQRKVEMVMDRRMKTGAVVVLQPYTGEILAMASRPGFNGNDLAACLNRPDAPLLNRAIAGFQPGSVFKVVVAAAALEEGVVTAEDMFYDPGYIDVGKLRFKGWNFDKGGNGRISFMEAMAFSSNPVFIEVGLKLGADHLVDYARKFGFGSPTDIGLEAEAGGNVPDAEDMFPGDLANMAIGQGQLEASPLQVASMIATVVNDGVRVTPRLVEKTIAYSGTTLRKFPVAAGKRIITKGTAAQLRTMLAATTKNGTGQGALAEKIETAGKTGSAETGRTDASGKGINHAWFAGYAPVKNPRYVIVVLVEEGRSGGDVAAPIFKEIVEELFEK